MNAVDYAEQTEAGPDEFIHRCHAENCAEPVDPTKLMCVVHWRLVPLALQKQVLDAYRPGQCEDKHPSHEWIKAARACIEAVATRERAMAALEKSAT